MTYVVCGVGDMWPKFMDQVDVDEYSDDNRVTVHCRRCGQEARFGTTTMSGGIVYRLDFARRHVLCASMIDDSGRDLR